MRQKIGPGLKPEKSQIDNESEIIFFSKPGFEFKIRNNLGIITFNSQALVAQKIKDELVFRRCEGERVEFF